MADYSNLKFRLGFNASTFTSPKIGGFTRHTVNLIEALHRLAPKVEIFLYANRELSPSLLKRIPFARPRIFPARPYFLWEQLALPLHLGRDSIDVFHSTTNTGVPYLRPFFTGTVQTVHDLFTHENLAHAPRSPELGGWRAYLGFWPSWWAAMSADRMITVSEHSRELIAQRYPGVAGSLRVIPNAADALFSPGAPDPDVLARFGLVPGYILYVGSFEARKNVATLVRAYQEMREGAGELPKLVLVGALDRLDRETRRMVESTPGVVTLAYCADEILAELYRGARFGVSPSLREGFGLPAVEFARAGIPALLANIPAYQEVAGEAAPYFDPRDSRALALAMRKMIADDAWRSEWQARTRNIAGRYSWDEIARATLDVYQKVME